MIPFTTQQFLKVFESYNETIYPVQWILLLMAVAAVLLSLKPGVRSTRIIAVLLFALWCWSGVVYHWVFFSHINTAAYIFGLLFIVQAFLLLFVGIARRQPVFRASLSVEGIFGALLIIYAVIIYPVLSYSFGHRYPQSPAFGVPCPITIFTIGLLLWLDQGPRFLMVIPLAWSLLGAWAVVSLGIREDLGLVVAGLIGTLLILCRPLTLAFVETPGTVCDLNHEVPPSCAKFRSGLRERPHRRPADLLAAIERCTPMPKVAQRQRHTHCP